MSGAGLVHLPAHPLVSEHICIYMLHMSCAVASADGIPCSNDILRGVWHCAIRDMMRASCL